MPHSKEDLGRGENEQMNMDILVIASKRTNLRCLTLPEREVVVLRPSGGIRDQAEGEILRVEVAKEWPYARQRYVSGKVVDSWIDGEVLAPVPLRLRRVFEWDPKEQFLDAWRDEIRESRRRKMGKPENRPSAKRGRHLSVVPPEPAPEWVMGIASSGRRMAYEMEQVLPDDLVPGVRPDDIDNDPIVYAVDHFHGGDFDTAFDILQRCLQADTRCIDAYAHLGLMRVGDLQSEWAHVWMLGGIKCYRAAVTVGERSLPPDFDGVLPWSCIDNRPFLRALHGLALCLWRLGDFAEALAILKRILRLNPDDNQGVRFLLPHLESGMSYLDYCRAEDEQNIH